MAVNGDQRRPLVWQVLGGVRTGAWTAEVRALTASKDYRPPGRCEAQA